MDFRLEDTPLSVLYVRYGTTHVVKITVRTSFSVLYLYVHWFNYVRHSAVCRQESTDTIPVRTARVIFNSDRYFNTATTGTYRANMKLHSIQR